METFEDNAHCSSNDIFIPVLVKKEPDSDCETDEENRNNILDYRVIKAEVKYSSDGSDAAMYDSDGDKEFKVKLEMGDHEMGGCGVDGGLRGRLKQETNPDYSGKLNTVFFICIF